MTHPRSTQRLALTGLTVLALAGGVPLAAGAQTTILSDNLNSLSSGTDAVTGPTYFTSSFGTGANTYTLNSVTLLLDNSIAGTAELDIYKDASDYQGNSGLVPGTLVGTLISPASYSTSALTGTTFTASGITLAANSTYWAVLKANTGEFDWSFTGDNSVTTGNGLGYQHTYGESDDAGTTWYTDNTDPQQMSVAATVIAPVPEASTAVSLGFPLGLLGAGFLLRRRMRARTSQK